MTTMHTYLHALSTVHGVRPTYILALTYIPYIQTYIHTGWVTVASILNLRID